MTETVEDILEHYGTKGMRWGVRKKSSGSTEATPVKVRAKPGQSIQTKGGKNQPAHEDAIKVAAAQQKVRKSGTQALSNQEMKLIVERMNLEQQYGKLNPKQASRGEKFLQDILETGAPELALRNAKSVLRDNKNMRVRVGLEAADFIITAASRAAKKK